jgi:hypothetical protein
MMASSEPEVMRVVQSSSRGRPISWIVVVAIMLGFILGGVGLVTGPTWWLFWTGAGIVVVGVIVGWTTGIMEDVH